MQRICSKQRLSERANSFSVEEPACAPPPQTWREFGADASAELNVQPAGAPAPPSDTAHTATIAPIAVAPADPVHKALSTSIGPELRAPRGCTPHLSGL